MGIWDILCPCFTSSASSELEAITPSIEERRQQMEAAALKRAQEQQSRGIKDPQKVQRMLDRASEADSRLEEAQKKYQGSSGAGLKWQMT